MIEARGLQLGYRDRVVLRDVALTLRPGELVAIVGPNGSGKSTLLRALAGALAPQAGSVAVDGRPVGSLGPAARARSVALVAAEEHADDDVAVREAVALGRLAHRPWWRWSGDERDEAIVEQALARVDLVAFAERAIATLSSGERQRVWIATALAQGAPTLLLDEPTSHLDLAGAYATLDVLHGLAADGAAIAVVLHDLNLAGAAVDRVVLIGEGTVLADGPVADVFRDELLSRAYGAEITVLRTGDGTLVAAPARRARAGT
ncbi:MAG TPA: ABC transporter ATP-binding protein [Candidatus Sulfotelmatobacter sp.]|nr:ABC transporter ATP-binding protein [Candidatus Sulfotelmatobacter sp.]